MISNHDRLSAAWNKRCSMIAEGYKLCAEGNKLRYEGNKLHAEGYKLRYEGNKLWAEGNKLWYEGNKLWNEGDKLWDSTVARCLGPLNSKQIWLCNDTLCLLTDGSLWKVP